MSRIPSPQNLLVVGREDRIPYASCGRCSVLHTRLQHNVHQVHSPKNVSVSFDVDLSARSAVRERSRHDVSLSLVG